MQIKCVTRAFAVAPQIAAADVAALAAAGYAALVNNRPDGEEPGQPSSAAIAAAAAGSRLAYALIPISGATVAEDDIAIFPQVLRDAGGAVFGFCRSGARSLRLWALSEAEHRDAGDLVRLAAAAGYDISDLSDRLAARRRPGQGTAS